MDRFTFHDKKIYCILENNTLHRFLNVPFNSAVPVSSLPSYQRCIYCLFLTVSTEKYTQYERQSFFVKDLIVKLV